MQNLAVWSLAWQFVSVSVRFCLVSFPFVLKSLFVFRGLFLRTHDLQLGEDLRCLLCGAADHGQAACTRARTREKRSDSCTIRWYQSLLDLFAKTGSPPGEWHHNDVRTMIVWKIIVCKNEAIMH